MKEHSYRFWHRGPGIAIGVIIGLIGAVVLAFVFGYFVMLLWNWLMPVIFHLGVINFWQAFGLALLGRLLFGSFGHHGHRNHKKHCKEQKGWEEWGNKDEWMPKGGWQEWKYYKEYWRKEGKNAFEKYLENRIIPEEPKQD